MLEFQSETFLLEFVVLVSVEAEEVGLALGCRPNRLIQLCEDVEVQHLLGEVATVKMNAQNGLVEHLEFLEREFLGQQFEADRLEMYAFAQLVQGHAQDVVVVECQLGYFVHTEPFCLGCIIAPFYLGYLHQRQEGDGEDTLARVAMGVAEAVELLYIIR